MVPKCFACQQSRFEDIWLWRRSVTGHVINVMMMSPSSSSSLVVVSVTVRRRENRLWPQQMNQSPRWTRQRAQVERPLKVPHRTDTTMSTHSNYPYALSDLTVFLSLSLTEPAENNGEENEVRSCCDLTNTSVWPCVSVSVLISFLSSPGNQSPSWWRER